MTQSEEAHLIETMKIMKNGRHRRRGNDRGRKGREDAISQGQNGFSIGRHGSTNNQTDVPMCAELAQASGPVEQMNGEFSKNNAPFLFYRDIYG